MKKYNAAERHARGELTINEMTWCGRALLALLSSQHSYYDKNDQCLKYHPRILERTATGKHYRMLPVAAEILGIKTVEKPGTHQTTPPTVLATIEEALERVEAMSASETAKQQSVSTTIANLRLAIEYVALDSTVA